MGERLTRNERSLKRASAVIAKAMLPYHEYLNLILKAAHPNNPQVSPASLEKISAEVELPTDPSKAVKKLEKALKRIKKSKFRRTGGKLPDVDYIMDCVKPLSKIKAVEYPAWWNLKHLRASRFFINLWKDRVKTPKKGLAYDRGFTLLWGMYPYKKRGRIITYFTIPLHVGPKTTERGTVLVMKPDPGRLRRNRII